MTRTRQNRIFSIILTTIILSPKSERASNSVVRIPQGKIALSTTRIANRIIHIDVIIVKGNTILTLKSSTPKFVLDKPLPLGFLLGCVRTIDTGKVERTNFRGNG